MSKFGKVFVAGVMICAPSIGLLAPAEAQPPIRIGASLAQTGLAASDSLEGLKMDHNTVYGGFRVDRDGVQIAHKVLLFQWQDGKKLIVWPEDLAPGKSRFPTPPWSQRP